jgi:hypothetical protein
MTEPNRTGVTERYRHEEFWALMTRMTGDEKHVGWTGQRRYGTPEQHDVLHGLDAVGLHRSISEFLTLEKTHTKGAVQ